MMNRAYSVLTVKGVDEEHRIIRGVATTPTPDRIGDIVEPLGVSFKNPLPLLWHHRSDKPVGNVKFDSPTKDGIEFEAKIPKIEETGALRDRIEEAWQSVKAGLVRGVSIGFRPLEEAFDKMTGGFRFIKSEVLELSLVTIPANSEATIQIIRSIDVDLLAASGNEDKPQKRNQPGDTGSTDHAHRVVNINKQVRNPEMDIAAQLKSFGDARLAKTTRMSEIMEEAGKKGETLNAEQTEEYDGLEGEVKSLDAHIKRLEALEASQAKSAKPVDGKDSKTGSESRDPAFTTIVRSGPKLEPGIRFARVAKCIGLAGGNVFGAAQIAEARFKDDAAVINVLKAAVAAGNTGNTGWAGALVGDETSVFADFVEFLRPLTILGKFGTGGVPSLRRVPFRVALISQNAGGTGYWVGEGAAKPLTKLDFSRTSMEPLKVANIAVVTEEVLRDSSPSAETIIRDQIAAALRERMDIDFIDPNKAAVTGISPASITNGISAIASTGADADAVREDIRLLFTAFTAAHNPPSSGVWIMDSATALALSLMQNPLGQSEFPGIGMNGGTFFGMPVIVSDYLNNTSQGAFVVLVNAQDIYLADEGGINVDMSREASLEMSDTPTGNSITPTAAQLVSLWQTNSVGFRAERTINWMRRRSAGVAYLSGVNWGIGL